MNEENEYTVIPMKRKNAKERNVRLKPVILVRYFRCDTNEGLINS